MTAGSLHSAIPAALGSRLDMTANQALELLCLLARQVIELHANGRIHANLTPDGIFVDAAGRPTTEDVPNVRLLTRAMRDWLPSELRPLVPLELPTDQQSAGSVLRSAQIAFDPREIDLHQLGALLCRLIAGAYSEAYLRSPRVKGRVPRDWQPIIDVALGCDGHRRPATAEEFLRLLTKCPPIALEAPPNEADAIKVGSDTSPSVIGNLKDGGKVKDHDTAVPGEGTDKRGAADRSDLPFRKLCHYEVVGWIGHGGMGDVYRGYERALDRTVALKVLPRELSVEPEFVRRFHAEASAAARVVHPHVIQIHFIGEDAGHHFFAMQYVDGESLAGLLARRGRLGITETLDILEQVLSGLGAAHRQGLIHRDIKPGNILLDRVHQRALLADFGLVKSLAAVDGRTATGVVMGTVDYIAPEQGRGLPVDHRVDLYAVGVLAYQMLSGRLPFSADSPTALIFQHVYEPAPPLADDVPPALAAVVAKLMAKSRESRHASAEAVLADLQAVRTRRPLPSGADVELAVNPQAFLQAAVSVAAPSTSTRIIRAPQFSDDAQLPNEPWLSDVRQPESASTWWSRVRTWCADWLRSRTPEWVQQMQSTQQQVGGAVAEYERRRDQLRSLVHEADDVLTALRSALSTRPDDADLQRAAADQEEQLGEMRLRLSQVEATLRQLCHQRDLLQARLKSAHAKLHLAGKPVNRPRSRRLAQIRLATLVVVISMLCVLAVRDGTRIRHSFASLLGGDRNPTPPAKAVSPVQVQPTTSTVPNSTIQKRAIFARHGGLFAIATFHESQSGSFGKKSSVPPEIKLWDLATGSEVVTLEQPHRPSGMAISPNGQFLLSAGRDAATDASELKIWELNSGKLRQHIKKGIPNVDANVGFSSDSQTAYLLLGVSIVKNLGVIDVSSGRVESIAFPQSHDQATAVAFCPARDLAAIGITQTIRNGRAAIDLYDLRQRLMISSIPLDGSVRGLTLSDDGELVAGSQAGQTTLWNTRDKSVVAKLPVKSSVHEEIAFSHDAAIFAASCRDGIDLLNVATKSVQTIKFSGKCVAIGFTSGGTFTVIPENGRITFFDPATGKEQLVPKLSSN